MSVPSNCRFSPPLASVIVVNYNYGRFLRDAVDSVFAQNYPHIECIIVDDASTDDSPTVVAEIAAAHPTVKIIKRHKNGDQLAASLEGLAASTGDYALFLNSDDFLLDQCIATHVFVNLSLRLPVGFTCSDMIQVVGDRLVLGSTAAMGDYIRSATPEMKPLVRPIPEEIAGPWSSTGLDRSVLDRLYSVDVQCRGWPWSATSAFFFRRDALSLWTDMPGLVELRRSTDGFFGHAINALTGSVLIDKSLSALRIHGANNFNKRAQLANLRNYDEWKDRTPIERRALLDEVIRDPARFPFSYQNQLRTVLEAFDTPDTTPDAPDWAKSSRLSYLLVKEFSSLAKFLGEEELVQWMLQRKIHEQAMRDAGIRW